MRSNFRILSICCVFKGEVFVDLLCFQTFGFCRFAVCSKLTFFFVVVVDLLYVQPFGFCRFTVCSKLTFFVDLLWVQGFGFCRFVVCPVFQSLSPTILHFSLRRDLLLRAPFPASLSPGLLLLVPFHTILLRGLQSLLVLPAPLGRRLV